MLCEHATLFPPTCSSMFGSLVQREFRGGVGASMYFIGRGALLSTEDPFSLESV